MFFATPLWADTSIEEAYDACGNSVSFDSVDLNGPVDAGWTMVDRTTAEHRDLLRDGILASMSTDRATRMDWTAAQTQATELAGVLLSLVSTESAALFVKGSETPKSLLIAMNRNDNPKFHQLHCVFAGNTSDAFKSYLETLQSMDSRAALEQATDGLHIFSQRTSGTTEDQAAKQYAFDVQIGAFQSSASNQLKRNPTVEIGMSMFRFTQR